MSFLENNEVQHGINRSKCEGGLGINKIEDTSAALQTGLADLNSAW